MRAALLLLAFGGCMIRQAHESDRFDSHGRLIEQVISSRQDGCSGAIDACHGGETQVCEVVQICAAPEDIEERRIYRYDVLGRPVARWHQTRHAMRTTSWHSDLIEDVEWHWDGSRPTPIDPRDHRVIEDRSLVAEALSVYERSVR